MYINDRFYKRPSKVCTIGMIMLYYEFIMLPAKHSFLLVKKGQRKDTPPPHSNGTNYRRTVTAVASPPRQPFLSSYSLNANRIVDRN